VKKTFQTLSVWFLYDKRRYCIQNSAILDRSFVDVEEIYAWNPREEIGIVPLRWLNIIIADVVEKDVSDINYGVLQLFESAYAKQDAVGVHTELDFHFRILLSKTSSCD